MMLTCEADERQRLRRHFDEVLSELAARDVSALPTGTRAARSAVLVELERYAARASFPRNRDFPRDVVPYFVDADGVRCAVAHLMEATGAHVLVADIAGGKNHARIDELARDPRLGAWLAAVGLEQAEAARIQPSYCFIAVAACVCNGQPPTFVEASAIDHTQNTARVRVTRVYGDTSLASIGDVLEVYPSRVDASAFLVPVYREPGSVGNVGSIDGDHVEFLCGFGDGLPRLLTADVIAAWGASDCQGTLLARDPSTADSICANNGAAEPEGAEPDTVEAAEDTVHGGVVEEGNGCDAGGASSALGLLAAGLFKPRRGRPRSMTRRWRSATRR